MANAAYVGVSSKARKVKKIYVGVDNYTPVSLPSGYTQIEYIQTSGTQWIDTGVNTAYELTADIEFINTSARNLMGQSTKAGYYFGVNANGYYELGGSAVSTVKGTSRHIISVSSTDDAISLTVNGSTITRSKSDSTVTDNFMLLGGLSDYPCSAKLYSCKLYNGTSLIRNFIPAKNSSGTIGLYDTVTATFYTNAGSGTFTAGTSEIKSIARKVRRAYVGVNGVARLFFTSKELAYYGTATALSKAREELAATSIGDYALFGGGEYSSTSQYATVDTYNSSLTKGTASDLAQGGVRGHAATSAGNYAYFAAGWVYGGEYVGKITAYNSSLTKYSISAFDVGAWDFAGTNAGTYALFAGGQRDSFSDTYVASVIPISGTSVSSKSVSDLSEMKAELAATTVGNYAIFAGGMAYERDETGATYVPSTSKTVDAYNASLTKVSSVTSLSVARRKSAAITVGNFALFLGGYNGSDNPTTTVDAYNTSLTRTIATVMSIAVAGRAAVTLGDYALIGGGRNSNISIGTVDVVDIYDKSLTRTTGRALSTARYNLAAAAAGDYALFGGGYGSAVSSVVDVYTLQE